MTNSPVDDKSDVVGLGRRDLLSQESLAADRMPYDEYPRSASGCKHCETGTHDLFATPLFRAIREFRRGTHKVLMGASALVLTLADEASRV